ncbi:hypothetical protein SPB21_03935 [Leptothoe sp. ISB3NOV94-8A]
MALGKPQILSVLLLEAFIMGYAISEIERFYEDMVYDYVDMLPENYLRAVVRNEYGGSPNVLHHIERMSIADLVAVVERNLSIAIDGRVYLNSTKTHSKTKAEVIAFMHKTPSCIMDQICSERFQAA